MNLQKLKEVEDLKVELANVKEANSNLYKDKIVPILQDKTLELLLEINEFFKEKGFITTNQTNKVKATYKTITFTAEIIESDTSIIIKQGQEDLANIYVAIKMNSGEYSFTAPGDKLEAEKLKLKKQIEQENNSTKYYENPVYQYGCSGINKRYSEVNSLLNDVFKEE